MSLSSRQQYQLRLTGADLLRSHPQLAGMLSMFGRLYASEGMPAWERAPSRRDRIREAAALLMEAIAVVIAAVSLLLRAVLALAGTAILRRGPGLPAPKARTHPPPPGSR
jgi:hypothetical protein